jgi:N-methylhydantoinase A
VAIRVATDIGGTFTDLAFLNEDTGEVGFAKVPTTPPAFEQGVVDAVGQAGLSPPQVTQFVHGTTVVINAITERRGAKTGLLTTRGMRDVLEIARGNRPDIYNLRYRKPPPFVPRNLRLEVAERLNARGEVVDEMDEESLRAAVLRLRDQGVEAAAICFLHAYANPDHERRAGEMVRELLPNIFVSISHQITREFREYERTNTTVLNSYIGPTTDRYLGTLERRLAELGVTGSPLIMHSNGGMSTVSRTKQVPINLVESGPAGGIIGAASLGNELGLKQLVTLDVGGTTAKMSLIEDGRVKVNTDYYLERSKQSAGYPIKAPVVDVIEIGAGGGSIAWMDENKAMRVGPRSAGAEPGPAAYGRPDGVYPTVTDANLIAGRLNPEFFLGGTMPLQIHAARAAYARLSELTGTSTDETARGVLRLTNGNMVNAIKIISVQRGHDPRDFALVAMGGGGPVHAAYLARELQISRVIVPVAPGHFSAFGMLTTDLRRDYIRTWLARTDQIEPDHLEEAFSDLENLATAEYIEDMETGDGDRPLGASDSTLRFEREADMRYRGQEHTVHVPISVGRTSAERLREVEEQFHQAHNRQYSFRLTSPIEFVNLHVLAFGLVHKPRRRELAPSAGLPLCHSTRSVWFEEDGQMDTPVFRRADLGPGDEIEGPALVEEAASVTLVYPGMRLSLEPSGELVVDTGA